MTWTVRLHVPHRTPTTVGSIDIGTMRVEETGVAVEEVRTRISFRTAGDRHDVVLTAEKEGDGESEVYLSLGAAWPGAPLFCFQGRIERAEVYRQSPHDPANHVFSMAMQPVPMAGIGVGSLMEVALSDAPAFSRNATTQAFDPAAGSASICSGDPGTSPGLPPREVKIEPRYHQVAAGRPHVFRCLLFRCAATSVPAMRDDVLAVIAEHWGPGKADRLGRVSFSTNYMHYRRNETGRSNYWVVPGIEYANKQYSRDAFWQCLSLPPSMAMECFLHEAHAKVPGAERPLFGLIWAGRLRRSGQPVKADDASWFLDYAEEHTRDGWYRSYREGTKYDMQSWYDLCAFSPEDTITYNQGLLALALLSARDCGLRPRTSPESAIARYREMFHDGRFPLSREKDLLSMDVLVGDLLAQVLAGRPFLDRSMVESQYDQSVRRALTEHGFKVVCRPDGSYPSRGEYAHGGYLNPHLADMEEGSYAHGGSYYLYDMLFLMDAHLHGIPDARQRMIWRTRLEFERGGTYHEHIHTVTGHPHKANQGWNGAVHALWRMLMEQGRADGGFLEAMDVMETGPA